MTTDDFDKIPKEELLIAAKEAVKSAKGLFNVAQNAASSKEFGVANSLLILASEECIKSAILTAGYFNVPLGFDIKPFFSDHKTKHLQAAEIQPAINMIWAFKDAYIKTLKNRKSDYAAFFQILVINLFASIAFQIGNKPASDFTAWWRNANSQKKDGFYVGYHNGKWSLPSSMTEKTYEQTLTMVQPFVECLQIINELKTGDNLLLSGNKNFTEEEINASGFKLNPGPPSDIGLDDYKPVT